MLAWSWLVLRASTALGKVLKGVSAAEERIKMVKELLLLPISRFVTIISLIAQMLKCFLIFPTMVSKYQKSFKWLMVSVSVCLGASGDIRKCLDLAQETPKLSRRSGHQLERFLLRRAQEMLRDQATLDQEYCLLLAYELLYLWNALGACLKHSTAAIEIGQYQNPLPNHNVWKSTIKISFYNLSQPNPT